MAHRFPVIAMADSLFHLLLLLYFSAHAQHPALVEEEEATQKAATTEFRRAWMQYINPRTLTDLKPMGRSGMGVG